MRQQVGQQSGPAGYLREVGVTGQAQPVSGVFQDGPTTFAVHDDPGI